MSRAISGKRNETGWSSRAYADSERSMNCSKWQMAAREMLIYGERERERNHLALSDPRDMSRRTFRVRRMREEFALSGIQR